MTNSDEPLLRLPYERLIPYLAIPGLGTLAAAVAAYLARRFTESYYAEWGIPVAAIDLVWTDYLFAAGRTRFTLFILLVLGFLAWQAIKLPKYKNWDQHTTKDAGWWSKYVDRSLAFLGVVSWFIAVVLFLVVISDTRWVETWYTLISFTVLFLAVYLSNSTYVRNWLRTGPVVQVSAGLGVLTFLISFLFFGPEQWGVASARAESESKIYRSVCLVADDSALGLEWTYSPDHDQWISEPVRPILETSDRLWFRPTDERTNASSVDSKAIIMFIAEDAGMDHALACSR